MRRSLTHLKKVRTSLLCASTLGWLMVPEGGPADWLPESATRVPAPATYHVSATGNDANDGSVARPWATIQHADSIVAAGDTVVVADGIYHGDLVLKKGGTS